MTYAQKFLSEILLSGCVLLAVLATAHAQYQVKSWTTEEGLPQNTVHSIAQTPDGYLWLTTLDGVVRYDGVKFTVFNKSNTKGIENNRFNRLIVDGSGDLWMGTEESGVTRYHEGSFQTYAIKGVPHNEPISYLSLNKQGELVVFTSKLVTKWNGQEFASYTPVAGETKDSVVLWGRDGAFWYLTERTLHRFKDNRVSEYNLPVALEKEVGKRLLEDRRGRIWIGTTNAGLFVLENDRLINLTVKDGLPSNNISPRIEDRNGNVWAVTNQGAVIIADGKISRLTSEEGLSENDLASIYEDREGNIWIGTLYRGLNRASPQSVTFYTKEDGLAADVVHPIYEDREGNVWIGGKGLTLYTDGRFKEIEERGNFTSKDVTAIHQDSRGRMWFGHWGGVAYYENGKFTDFTENLGFGAAFTDIHEDRNGNLWFATRRGVYRYRDGEVAQITITEGLPNNDVKVIHETRDGTFWFGTYAGLTRYNPSVGINSLETFTTDKGLSSNLIRSLYEDADGALWIGSYDGGLMRFKDERFTRYTTREGLFNDGVFQILEDARGNLWMSSNRGIYRVAKQQLNDFADGRIARIESIALSKADGLLETECNGGQQPAGIKTRDGKFWFPTQGGVAVVNPNELKTNPHPPPVHLESAKIDSKSIAFGDSIQIEPGNNNLEIAYTGLSFIKPEFVNFKYKLEGQDAEWVEAGTRRTAYYSYIPPGEYVFTVIAANSDGVWNTTGARIKIVVLPPVYRTWWFWISICAALAAAVYLFYRRRIARLERAQKAQEEFSRKLLSSQENERQRIASELHDSIGQSLLIIKNRAFLALNDLDEPESVREQLEELSVSASGAIEECREISYNLRPYQINRFGLTKTLEAIFRRITEVTEIETTIEIDSIDEVFSSEAETNVYRIVQESVNNIIKHSGASEADLFIKRRGAEVDILIQDNGRGFDKNASGENGNGRGGFGLIGMTERVRMLGGVYEIESQPGDGTSVKIKLAISPVNERN